MKKNILTLSFTLLALSSTAVFASVVVDNEPIEKKVRVESIKITSLNNDDFYKLKDDEKKNPFKPTFDKIKIPKDFRFTLKKIKL